MSTNSAIKLIPLLFLSLIIPILAPTQTSAVVQKISLTRYGRGNPAPAAQTPPPEPILIAKHYRTRRLKFTRGKNSIIIEDAVIRGTRDIYLVGAKRQQKITVNITSLEDNAVFDIKAPNKRILKQEATTWNGVLPATGDYQIIVGGTRGNAAYKMEVIIK